MELLSIYREKAKNKGSSFIIKDGLLIKDYKLVVFKNGNLRIKFIEVIYCLITLVHLGRNKTKRMVYKRY